MSRNNYKGDGFVSTKIAFQKLRAKNITLSTVVGVVEEDVDFLWKILEGSLSFRIFLEVLTPFFPVSIAFHETQIYDLKPLLFKLPSKVLAFNLKNIFGSFPEICKS
jgi:hypothetical protein